MGKKQREKFKVFPNSFPSVTKDGVYPVEFLGCADFSDLGFENGSLFNTGLFTRTGIEYTRTRFLFEEICIYARTFGFI